MALYQEMSECGARVDILIRFGAVSMVPAAKPGPGELRELGHATATTTMQHPML
jgi:hypothetical protein